MTERETAQIMGVMQSIYPDSFREQSTEMLKITVKVWAQTFQGDDAETVRAAVMAHIASSTDRFMPPPGVIKQRIVDMQCGDTMTPQEAWQLVSSAAQRGIHHAREEFDKLPPVVQRIVGSPNQLREWAMMDAETVQSVVASNFQRSFTARMSREREQMALPPKLRETMRELAGRLSMDELPGESEKIRLIGGHDEN